MNRTSNHKDSCPSPAGDRDIEFDVKQYCEKNRVEVKDMYFD